MPQVFEMSPENSRLDRLDQSVSQLRTDIEVVRSEQTFLREVSVRVDGKLDQIHAAIGDLKGDPNAQPVTRIFNEQLAKHESQIRGLQRFAWMASGAIAAAELVIHEAAPYLAMLVQ